MLLVIDFSLLFFSLFIAMAMSVTMTIANIVSVNTVVSCDNSDTGSGGGCVVVSDVVCSFYSMFCCSQMCCCVVHRCNGKFGEAPSLREVQ